MGLVAEAFVQVLLQERARLLAIAVAITGDAHAAEDVFQQVVAAALQTKNQFRERDHVLAWGLRAARHRALNVARDRRFTPLPVEVLDLLDGALDDPAGPPVSDHAAALPRCVEGLSDSARRLVRFRYEEGLSAAAISGRIGRLLTRFITACQDSPHCGSVELQLTRMHEAVRGRWADESAEAGLLERDLDELFLRYCDGLLNSEEIAALGRRIQENPDGRAQLVSVPAGRLIAQLEYRHLSRNTRHCSPGH